jgi:hypothetical protein
MRRRSQTAPFELGDWVIETKSHRSGSIVAVIPSGENSICDLYIVEFDSKYEIFDSQTIIQYDKYYWDDMEKNENG